MHFNHFNYFKNFSIRSIGTEKTKKNEKCFYYEANLVKGNLKKNLQNKI